jgi:hypothetical protein
MKNEQLRLIGNCLICAGIGLAIGGCASVNEAWMKGYVAVHDAADAALSNKVDHLPDATNMVPVMGRPDHNGDTTGMICACDLSKPACTSYEDVRQITIGNSQWEECGLESQYHILIRPVVTFGGHIICVSSILEKEIKSVDGGYELHCPVLRHGYTWHVLGYSLGDDHVERMQVRFKTGERLFVPRDGKRAFVFVEGRK